MAEMSIKKAAFINAGSKYISILLNLVFSAVLARLLSPDDYGIVAVTAVFTTFFNIIADMGLGTAVIQNKKLTNVDTDNIYSFTVKIAMLLGMVFACFSVPMSMFYNNKVYIPIGALLAVSLIFNTLNMIPNALLMKGKRFLLVGVRTIITSCVSSIICIILAFCGFKYYALVLQSVLNAVSVFLWNYILTKPKFHFQHNKESIAKVRRFSAFQFAFNLINYFARNLDNLLISKFMGTSALGYYDKAYKLMLYPINNLTNVITPVLHPILSEHQTDRRYIYNKYIEIVKILSIIGIFIMIVGYFAGDEIITIIFGNKWIKAVPCFKYMALAIWAQLLLSSTGTIFQSLGKPKILFIAGCVTSIMTVLGIVEGIAEHNIESIARNVAISYNLQLFFSYYMLINIAFGFQLRHFAKRLLPDILTAFSLFVMIDILQHMGLFGISNNKFVLLIIKTGTIGLMYLFALFITKQYKYLLLLIGRKK